MNLQLTENSNINTFFSFLNWSDNCFTMLSGLCCTTTQISHKCIYLPLPLAPPSHFLPSHPSSVVTELWAELPVSCSIISLVISLHTLMCTCFKAIFSIHPTLSFLCHCSLLFTFHCLELLHMATLVTRFS